MKKIYTFSILLLVFTFTSSSFGYKQSPEKQRKEFVKEINRSFDLSRQGTTSISNTHGKVEIKTWEKPEVKIDVSIVVQAKDEESAEAVFDRISIDFQNADDLVKAVTDIQSKKSSWSWKMSWGNDKDRDDFEINYEVYMPKYARLDLKNKYGDTFVAEIDGHVSADISYGNIRFEGVSGMLNMDLNYGDAQIIRANEISSEIKYSKLNLRKAKDADFTTKYSKLYIDETEELRINSKYDEYEIYKVKTLRAEANYDKISIREIDNLIADAKYTDFIVESVNKDLDVMLAYGGMKIETLSANFENVRLDGSYVNFKLTAAPDACYKVDASASYGDIQLPESAETIYERDSGYSSRVEAHVGCNDPNKNIKVKISYGDVSIR